MNKTLSRVLWVISGILLVICGILCLKDPGAALTGMTVVLGAAMLFSGIVDIVIFATSHNYMIGSGWFLLDGILTVLLSLFVLGNDLFTALTLPFIFGMWLIFSGISKFVNSFDLQRLGVKGWGWFTAYGILMAVVGFISFLSPVTGIVTITVMVGILLILQGIASVLRGCFSGRLRR